MDREFTRKELYDLVWSQPIKTVAASIGISDVALAKHCKKADIPVPSRGYWARKQAGKPTVQIALPPRFPGFTDRVGGASERHYYWGSDWVEHFLNMPIPPVPVFDEEMSSVSDRSARLVGKVDYKRKFQPAHPLVAKLLAHDEERRRQFNEWRSSYYAPRYDSGVERRRLLIINALFLTGARLGCRPAMSTSKYRQEAGSERNLCITVGRSDVSFNIEPIPSKKENKDQGLCLSLKAARTTDGANKSWQDTDQKPLEDQLTEVMVEMLISAENSYRNGIIRRREWVIERKAEAEAELQRRKDEAERQERARQEKLARERIGRLLSQSHALSRANQIRSYVQMVRSRGAEMPVEPDALDKWAIWAESEADRIDPVRNGTIALAIQDDFSQ